MYNLKLMREDCVSIDNWNSARTEYYTTYKHVHDTDPLVKALTDAVVVAAEHWPLSMDEFTGVMLTTVYDHCEYVERPFSSADVEDIFDWLPEYVEDIKCMNHKDAGILAHEWVNESLCDFLSEHDIERFY